MALLKKQIRTEEKSVMGEQVLVRKDRVRQREAEGFKIVNRDNVGGKDRHGRILGVRTNSDDLVLMER